MTMEGSVQVKYSNLLLKKDCHQWRHRMLNKILTAVALVMLLAGCSAFTSSQSLIADENWFQLGYNKGEVGREGYFRAILAGGYPESERRDFAGL